MTTDNERKRELIMVCLKLKRWCNDVTKLGLSKYLNQTVKNQLKALRSRYQQAMQECIQKFPRNAGRWFIRSDIRSSCLKAMRTHLLKNSGCLRFLKKIKFETRDVYQVFQGFKGKALALVYSVKNDQLIQVAGNLISQTGSSSGSVTKINTLSRLVPEGRNGLLIKWAA
ncbi:MAG: hypothetical protein ACXV7J_07675 [Methylomonas sp.]